MKNRKNSQPVSNPVLLKLPETSTTTCQSPPSTTNNSENTNTKTDLDVSSECNTGKRATDDKNTNISIHPRNIPRTLSNISETNYDNTFPIRQDEGEYFKIENFNFWKFLEVEMLGIGEPERVEQKAVANLNNFLTVPFKLEFLLIFGFFICLDSFLYVFTYLPIRVLYSIFQLIFDLFSSMPSFLILLAGSNNNVSTTTRKHRFHRMNAYDMMRGCLVLIGSCLLQFFNMSRVYHFIRGQSLIKLYVLTAIMDMFDRLMGSFGIDVFDSLSWQTRIHPEQFTQMIKLFIVASIYVILHSALYFIHIATLTVAINSTDITLITVVILNNVAEIKSHVFKKFEKNSLFQLACSDITERFKTTLFLVLNLLVGLSQAGVLWKETLWTHLCIFCFIMLGEAITDFLKHAFVTKFNRIDPTVFDDYVRVLRNDILNCHKDKIILDHTYSITRRLGLSQIPLGCVSMRYIILALSSTICQTYLNSLTRNEFLLYSVLGFLSLVVVKTVLGVGLIYYAGRVHNIDLATHLSKRTTPHPSDKHGATGAGGAAAKPLSSIERYSSFRGRVLF